jgi:uncharacterized protein YegP (UPF0339 family)
MPNTKQRSSGKLYVWKSEKDGKWYRTGVSTNGKITVPSEGYNRKGSAEDVTPVLNFVRNPTIIYGKPPRKPRAKK